MLLTLTNHTLLQNTCSLVALRIFQQSPGAWSERRRKARADTATAFTVAFLSVFNTRIPTGRLVTFVCLWHKTPGTQVPGCLECLFKPGIDGQPSVYPLNRVEWNAGEKRGEDLFKQMIRGRQGTSTGKYPGTRLLPARPCEVIPNEKYERNTFFPKKKTKKKTTTSLQECWWYKG